jgi:hypothetical protein
MPRLSGYVDDLQCLIANSAPTITTPQQDLFSAEVRVACGVRGNVADDWLLGEVEGALRTSEWVHWRRLVH